MDMSIDAMPSREMNIGSFGAVLNANSATGAEDAVPGMGPAVDKLEFSNAGKMISSGINLAQEGDPEVQGFMTKLEQGMQTGDLDLAALLEEVPEALTSALESEGVDLEDALQTLSDFSANMPPPPPPGDQAVEESGEASGQMPPGGGAGGARGAGGAPVATEEEEEEDTTTELEDEISELQQEISALQGKEQTEYVKSELEAKQSELSSVVAELSLAESEEG